jgi:hypothetical protein
MYLNTEAEDRLKAITKAIPVLSEAMILSAIVAAGLEACSHAGNRLPLPLGFEIVEAAEPSTTKPRR